MHKDLFPSKRLVFGSHSTLMEALGPARITAVKPYNQNRGNLSITSVSLLVGGQSLQCRLPFLLWSTSVSSLSCIHQICPLVE